MKQTTIAILPSATVSVLAVALSQLLLLSACQQADEPQTVPTEGVPLQLSSGISTIQTRAFDSSWDYQDKIGVFTTQRNTTTITQSGSDNDENRQYVIANTEFGGSTNPVSTHSGSTYSYKSFLIASTDKQIYLPADGSAVDVYAYYPYTANVTESAPLNITVPTTQTLANQKTVDVLKASVKSAASSSGSPYVNIDNTSAELLFSHVMSKVLVRVVVGEGYGASDLNGSNISKVELTGQPTTATFKPISQTLTITQGSNTIQMYELSSGDPDYVSQASVSLTEGANPTSQPVIHNYRAIVLPNTGNTGVSGSNNPATSGTQRQINFTVGSITYSYNMTENLQPGYQTEYTIILAANEVVVTAAITPWNANVITPAKPLLPNS